MLAGLLSVNISEILECHIFKELFFFFNYSPRGSEELDTTEQLLLLLCLKLT